MSTLDVRVKTIDEVRGHPNADRLSIVVIGGWQCVTGKDQFTVGQSVVYFPPDTELPQHWTDIFGVTKYCSPVKSSSVGPGRYRIRQAKLRGEPSFGLVVDTSFIGKAIVGEDVAFLFDATKYEPPVKATAGDAAPDHQLFIKYTEIENLRNYPNLFLPGEELMVTEKIHGSCCRVGVVWDDDLGLEQTFLAGSKGLRRQDPGELAWKDNTYWFPWSLPQVRELLYALSNEGKHKQVILFGEVYGRGIQSFDYGSSRSFRAFDLYVDGKYLDAEDFFTQCWEFEVETVPLLSSLSGITWQGPESIEQLIKPLAEGRAFSGNHIKEGVVIRPRKERHDPEVGRVVLKFLSDNFLLGNYDQITDL